MHKMHLETGPQGGGAYNAPLYPLLDLRWPLGGRNGQGREGMERTTGLGEN